MFSFPNFFKNYVSTCVCHVYAPYLYPCFLGWLERYSCTSSGNTETLICFLEFYSIPIKFFYIKISQTLLIGWLLLFYWDNWSSARVLSNMWLFVLVHAQQSMSVCWSQVGTFFCHLGFCFQHIPAHTIDEDSPRKQFTK